MSNVIHIQLTPQAKQLLANLETLPQKLAATIAQTMDKENQLTVGHIQKAHLTGKGPFPIEEHRLGVVTNRLRGSLHANAAVVQGDLIVSSIGTNVSYAFPHEFGALIHHPARQSKVRLRTDARGNLVRQLGHSNLARFAGAQHKRAREVTSDVEAYDVEMPERAPIRTGIQECAKNYGRSISEAIVGDWNNLAHS